MLTKLPGYYRNAELAILPVFSRNTKVASLWARELLKYDDRTRWLDNEKTIPLRPYYRPATSTGKNCLHKESSPSPWCLSMPQFVNQNNPIGVIELKIVPKFFKVVLAGYIFYVHFFLVYKSFYRQQSPSLACGLY